MRTTATIHEDKNDVQARCQACAAMTYGLVQVHIGEVWLGAFPLCDECQALTLDEQESLTGM